MFVVVSAQEERRQRSHSEPLSLEATKVAKELKRLSDALNFYYKAIKKDTTSRYR